MSLFCSLFSGSSGNCSLVSSGNVHIIIDCGVSAKALCNAVKELDIDISGINAILITHEHSDHIKGLSVLSRRYQIPVYANIGTLCGIKEETDKLNEDVLHEFLTGDTLEIDGMSITSFKTSHDSRESAGFRIHTPDDKKIAVATDLGYVSDDVMSHLQNCDLVMIESNHDVGMLQNGRYPYFLKRRILSKTGHLSNDDCAKILPSLVETGTKHFVLAHLSKDNNMPDLALQTSISYLTMQGIKQDCDYEIETAPRFTRSRVYHL